MATIKSEYYRFNGSIWDLHYFKTSADLIVETASYKVLTADERLRIAAAAQLADSNQRLEFGGSTQYVRLAYGPYSKAFIKHSGGAEQEVWTNANFTPGNYLPLTGGSLSGPLIGTSLSLSSAATVGGVLYVNGGIASDNASMAFNGLDLINFNEAILRNIGAPTAGKDAANKEYVDNLVAEGVKPIPPVKCATVQNMTLSGLVQVDNVQLVAGDRVLVKNQTTASQNGIYTAASGAWTKVTNTAIGFLVFVENGNTQNDWKFYAENDTTWIPFSKVDTISAGDGLAKTGTSLRIKTISQDLVAGVVTDMIADGAITLAKIANIQEAEEAVAWNSMGLVGNSRGLRPHLTNIYSAIKLLRGTTNYNTNNTQTIAGAYTLANSKIKSEIGANVPGTTGYTAGDLFFKTLA